MREFDIREFTNYPKLIVEDFNQKIYSRQNIPQVSFLSRTTTNQPVDFYREEYKKEMEAYKAFMEGQSSEEDGRDY